MQHASHQTIKLGKGKHSSPQHGACVMELASMLAGEPFSDHPQSVSPVIASFLRNYNDVIDDDRRQDLYAYASKVVGTAGSLALETARANRLLIWADQRWEQRARRSIFARLKARTARRAPHTDPTLAGRYALHAIGRISDETHAAVLRVVDELIALGTAGQAEDAGMQNLAEARLGGSAVAHVAPEWARGCICATVRAGDCCNQCRIPEPPTREAGNHVCWGESGGGPPVAPAERKPVS